MYRVELMFDRKIKPMFNKNEYFNRREKVFFKIYQKGKEFWKDSLVKKKKDRPNDLHEAETKVGV